MRLFHIWFFLNQKDEIRWYSRIVLTRRLCFSTFSNVHINWQMKVLRTMWHIEHCFGKHLDETRVRKGQCVCHVCKKLLPLHTDYRVTTLFNCSQPFTDVIVATGIGSTWYKVDKSLSHICRILIAGFDNQRGQSTLNS